MLRPQLLLKLKLKPSFEPINRQHLHLLLLLTFRQQLQLGLMLQSKLVQLLKVIMEQQLIQLVL